MLLLVSALWAASGALAGELKKATLIPQWEPQAQFAGYYVAKAKGFYAAHGVDMTILRGGPYNPPSRLLAEGRAQFGTLFLSTALKERAAGLPLVNLAQIMRGSTLLLVARAASGIKSPADFQGKRVSLWGKEFSLQAEAFFARHGVTVVHLPQAYSVDLFLRGGTDAACAMYYNEYHTLLNSGLDPKDLIVFPLRDYGFDFPEDGLYCLDATLASDPELCRAVTEASLEGWLYVFAHPDEALDIVMDRVRAANLPTNRMHQKWMLGRLVEAMAPREGASGPGPLSRQEFDTMARALRQAGLLARPVTYEEFHADIR
ncbi:ABC transporter substrate-binding protein [Fundidesulfovibrio butyratiphilus]